jgi:hypothetical protein
MDTTNHCISEIVNNIAHILVPDETIIELKKYHLITLCKKIRVH